MPVDAQAAVLIFAKAPEPGLAKTRLIPVLGAAGAARLQAAMAEHAIAAACGAGLGDVHVWCTPSAEHPFFVACRTRWSVEGHTQHGDTLGERLRVAHDFAFARYRRVVIIGTDCPALTAHGLHAAAGDLAHHDALIIPAEDGGYVLLALSRPCPEAFAGIDWGSERVLAQTLRQLRASARTIGLHQPLWDVDRPEDLARMRSQMPQFVFSADVHP